jgi:hypothetical protein
MEHSSIRLEMVIYWAKKYKIHILYTEKFTMYTLLHNLYLSVFLCWVPVANAPGCTAACKLIVQTEILEFPTCTTRCPTRHNDTC